MVELSLTVHRESYVLVKMQPGGIFHESGRGRFSSVSWLNGEATVACESAFAPTEGEIQHGFRLIEIGGDFALDSIGVVAAVAGPLAASGVSLFAFSVWSTDVFLVQDADLERATLALVDAGHFIIRA